MVVGNTSFSCSSVFSQARQAVPAFDLAYWPMSVVWFLLVHDKVIQCPSIRVYLVFLNFPTYYKDI